MLSLNIAGYAKLRLVDAPGMPGMPGMSGSLTQGGGENGPNIRGACATRNFTYLARGP